MVKRTRIGLLFSYDEKWIGGTYYILNLIHALNRLPETLKPHLVIISEKESDFKMIKPIAYPYVDYELYKKEYSSLAVRGINKIARKLTNRQLILTPTLPIELDILFPGSVEHYFSNIPYHLFWIPDFQEDYLSHLFSASTVKYRKDYQRYLVDKLKSIIFSSKDAFNDFSRLYPESAGNYGVVNFAVSHPSYKHLPIDTLTAKYDLNKPYFFSPNQFWVHKNHQLVLDSLKLLKQQNKLDFKMAFSGKESDFRNPNYVINLKNFVKENDLEEHVHFLGFIDRKEQLQLMNHAIAIVQPSLFEGWSTVVEDAKSMNQNIIASDLKVHKEQLGNKGYFFKRNDKEDLVMRLLEFRSSKKQINRPDFKYDKNIIQFGKAFIQNIKKVVDVIQ